MAFTWKQPAHWRRGKDESAGPHKFKAKACWVLADLTLVEESNATPETKAWLARERKGDPTHVRRFPSKKEAKRWIALNLLQRAGKIRDLEAQHAFWLHAKRPDGLMEKVTRYIADFVYFDLERGREIVEDAKGFRDAKYELKKKWFAVEQGREIEEV